MSRRTQENLAPRWVFLPDLAEEIKLVARLVALYSMNICELWMALADLRDEVREGWVWIFHAHTIVAIER